MEEIEKKKSESSIVAHKVTSVYSYSYWNDLNPVNN